GQRLHREAGRAGLRAHRARAARARGARRAHEEGNRAVAKGHQGRRDPAELMKSAGLLLYRWKDGALEVLLAHPGGPFWAKRDAGAWTIPKGEIGEGEEAFDAARREFREETGLTPGDECLPLAPR